MRPGLDSMLKLNEYYSGQNFLTLLAKSAFWFIEYMSNVKGNLHEDLRRSSWMQGKKRKGMKFGLP